MRYYYNLTMLLHMSTAIDITFVCDDATMATGNTSTMYCYLFDELITAAFAAKEQLKTSEGLGTGVLWCGALWNYPCTRFVNNTYPCDPTRMIAVSSTNVASGRFMPSVLFDEQHDVTTAAATTAATASTTAGTTTTITTITAKQEIKSQD